MEKFISKIHINKIFKLEDVDINISEKAKKHLIITGKNGCGKTSILNALSEFLQNIYSDSSLGFLSYNKSIEAYENSLKRTKDEQTKYTYNKVIEDYKRNIERVYGKLNISFNNENIIYDISKQLLNGDFIIAYYKAERNNLDIEISKNPTKPNLNRSNKIVDKKTSQFLFFLADLKLQEALARNEGEISDADEIHKWFENFINLLRNIFDDPKLELKFNYKDYSFKIKQGNFSFAFNELSDGFSAILDIVSDLILKMQNQDNLTRAYNKEGIVLIDEVETHLHMQLQRQILPLLTRVFPKIQFIVTTHSPFVLNSLNTAVAFDLETKTQIEDIANYSYQALTEGYFNVETQNSFLKVKLDRFIFLSNINHRSLSEEDEYQKIKAELDSLDENMAPSSILRAYKQIKLSIS